ncbi:MAG: hypothetical protein KatS3mg003_0841 [Candidatus Nitrosocaldaceae archaeon]|nr:MAG: hypothetical protein KatS3mg003_0841 [Candidatus Nitrosocaldaceae archaeon]
MDNKIRVIIDRELAKELRSMMRKDDSYNTIVRMLLEEYKKRRENNG